MSAFAHWHDHTLDEFDDNYRALLAHLNANGPYYGFAGTALHAHEGGHEWLNTPTPSETRNAARPGTD